MIGRFLDGQQCEWSSYLQRRSKLQHGHMFLNREWFFCNSKSKINILKTILVQSLLRSILSVEKRNILAQEQTLFNCFWSNCTMSAAIYSVSVVDDFIAFYFHSQIKAAENQKNDNVIVGCIVILTMQSNQHQNDIATFRCRRMVNRMKSISVTITKIWLFFISFVRCTTAYSIITTIHLNYSIFIVWKVSAYDEFYTRFAGME